MDLCGISGYVIKSAFWILGVWDGGKKEVKYDDDDDDDDDMLDRKLCWAHNIYMRLFGY